MKILFVGRFFHLKSASAEFFIDYLVNCKGSDVDRWYPEGSSRTLIDIMSRLNLYDLVICWQSEHLSYYFSKYAAVINVSMYDGVQNRNDVFFKFLSACSNINFSTELHSKMLSLSLQSESIIYATEPMTTNSERSDLSVFFWERDPSYLSADKLLDLIDGKVQDIYLHCPRTKINTDRISTIHVSEYFDKKQDFVDYISKSSFVIASRATEGIGMSFLDCMAVGLIPIGLDYATLNQYVVNGVSGVLLSKIEDLGEVDFKQINVCEMRREMTCRLNSLSSQYRKDIDVVFEAALSAIRGNHIDNSLLMNVIDMKYAEPDICFDAMDAING